MKPLLNILIVEPSDIIREGVVSLLNESGGFNILAPLTDAHDLTFRLPSLQPDLLLINPTLLPAPARMSLASIQQARPNMGIAALVYQYVEPSLFAAFKSVLDIREPRNHVAQLLRESAVTELPDAADESYELSERETEVLVLVGQGLSSKEIADRLNISIHTVNTHRKNITHKTGIKSVAGLTVYALLHNLC